MIDGVTTMPDVNPLTCPIVSEDDPVKHADEAGAKR